MKKSKFFPMKNTKFLDNPKRAIGIYSFFIFIFVSISIIAYTPNELSYPEISSSLLINYSLDNVSISQEVNSSSLRPLAIYLPENASLVKTNSTPSQLTFDSESISQGINFIGIVLALLFTLIVLPVQHILGKYSQELVNRVLYDNTFIFTLFFFVFVFIVEIVELFIFSTLNGNYWSYISLVINLALILLALLTLLIFISRVFYLLDIRNHLSDIKDETIDIIPLACENPKFLRKVINKTEIIFDSIQKSLKDDRFETVISGLNNIQDITICYIKKCKIEENNEFITVVIKGLYDTKDIISSNNNPKTLDKLILISVKMGRKMARLNKIPSDLILNIVNLLRDIILSTEIVKKTSTVQIKGIDGLFDLAELSIKKDSSILMRVIRAFGKIGRIKEIDGFRFELRTYSNSKLSELLFLSYNKLNNLGEYEFKQIIQEIDQNIIGAGSEDGKDLYSTEIRPFIDPNKNYSLSNFFIKISENSNDFNPDDFRLDLMKTIIKNFNSYLSLNIRDDYLLYRLMDIAFVLNSNYKTLIFNVSRISKFENNKKLNETKNELFKILEMQMNILYFIIKYYIRYSDLKLKFKDYISLIPLSFYLISFYNNENIFDEFIVKWTRKIFNFIETQLEIYNKRNESYNKVKKNKKRSDNRKDLLIDIYPYLRLIGALFYKNYKQSTNYGKTINKIRHVLKKYETVGLYDEVDVYLYVVPPSLGDIEDKELKDILEKVNKFHLDTDEFDESFIGDFGHPE